MPEFNKTTCNLKRGCPVGFILLYDLIHRDRGIGCTGQCGRDPNTSKRGIKTPNQEIVSWY